MKDLTDIVREHKNQLRSIWPFIWLYELQTKDEPPTRYRFASFHDVIHFGQDSADPPQPIPYYPAPIIHGGITQDGEGSLPTISVTLGNTMPGISPVIHTSRGFVGQQARIILVSALDLDDVNGAIIEDAEIVGATMNTKSITFKLSAKNLHRAIFPRFVYTKRRCRWLFGTSECGYDLHASGAGFVDCTYDLDACIERGDDELANPAVGIRLHPERIGLFAGIPRLTL